MSQTLSWGRYPHCPQIPHNVFWPEDVPNGLERIAAFQKGVGLAYGQGRSYGDSCLSESGHLLAMAKMNRILFIDWKSGLIFAQAGLTLAELINIALPRGFFPPVTPGTKFITLGGAVANDVHGKNHHVHGTFGCHVKRLILYRSDEGIVECSQSLRKELFEATIGGLGLTGVILAVALQLRRVTSNQIEQRNIRFQCLDEFFDLSQTQDAVHEYTVAWVDCLASGAQTGRGHYMAGNHAKDGALTPAPPGRIGIPFDPPCSLINAISLRIFNTLYYHRQYHKETVRRVCYDPFFYPLDAISQWNRLYGRAGFQQYQCVVPKKDGREIIRAVMKEIAKSGTGSFLAVLKRFGNLPSPGLLSFPLEGVTLALDFPQRAEINLRLFAKLDRLVHDAGGRLYPAKDAHMHATDFKKAYPRWEAVEALRDPKLNSLFWKRVTQ
jgi:FAD/FMN-containing dehydrogenase